MEKLCISNLGNMLKTISDCQWVKKYIEKGKNNEKKPKVHH